jgi:hypothetical protein
MRFRGGGVGHKITRDWDNILHAEGRHDPPDDSSDEDGDTDEGDDSDVVADGEEEDTHEIDDGAADGEEEHAREVDDGVDKVVADEGEGSLDEVIWEQEEFDAL